MIVYRTDDMKRRVKDRGTYIINDFFFNETIYSWNKELHHILHHIFNSSLFEIMAREAQKLAYRATYLTDKNIERDKKEKVI